MRCDMEIPRPRRACATVAGFLLTLLLALWGCSRSGALSGDVVVRTPSGETGQGARISVFLILSSDAFEREWGEAVTAFRDDVAPAMEAQRGAEHRAKEARLAWDRALASRGRAGSRRGPWTITLRDSGTSGSQELWRRVRVTDGLLFQARKRVWEIVRTHEEQAHALARKHAAQRVQTDETGHYVLVNVPTGRAYVYTRWREAKADFVWFVPIEIQTGTQRADLTQDNQRHWPFVP